MPRIPLSEGRQILPQRHDAVHAPTVIGGDFGMEESRALINAGDRIRGAGEKIAGAGLAFASALVEKENHLAAAEDRNLLNRYMRELNAKLASNPNASDEQKNAWIAERARQYDEERKPYLDKMSTNFRKQHNLEIENIRTTYHGEQERIMIAGRAQRVYDSYKERIKEADMRGDLEEHDRLMRAAQGGGVPVFSKEEEDRINRDYQHLADFGAARRAVEANEVNIDVKLRERDEKGNYKHFTRLTVSEREQLARTAKANRREAEHENNMKFALDLADGKISITLDELKKQHDTGKISDYEYAARRPLVEAQGKQLAREKDPGRAAAGYRKMQQAKKDALLAQAYFENFSPNPEEFHKQLDSYLMAANAMFADNPRMLVEVNKEIRKYAAASAEGKDDWNLPNGERVRDYILAKTKDDDTIHSAAAIRRMNNGKAYHELAPEKRKEYRARHYAMIVLARQMVRVGRPLEDIKKMVDNEYDLATTGEIEKLMAAPVRFVRKKNQKTGEEYILDTQTNTKVHTYPGDKK